LSLSLSLSLSLVRLLSLHGFSLPDPSTLSLRFSQHRSRQGPALVLFEPAGGAAICPDEILRMSQARRISRILIQRSFDHRTDFRILCVIRVLQPRIRSRRDPRRVKQCGTTCEWTLF
ncbi:unnamed protein product, partial [Prunus brigantina]